MKKINLLQLLFFFLSLNLQFLIRLLGVDLNFIWGRSFETILFHDWHLESGYDDVISAPETLGVPDHIRDTSAPVRSGNDVTITSVANRL